MKSVHFVFVTYADSAVDTRWTCLAKRANAVNEARGDQIWLILHVKFTYPMKSHMNMKNHNHVWGLSLPLWSAYPHPWDIMTAAPRYSQVSSSVLKQSVFSDRWAVGLYSVFLDAVSSHDRILSVISRRSYARDRYCALSIARALSFGMRDPIWVLLLWSNDTSKHILNILWLRNRILVARQVLMT